MCCNKTFIVSIAVVGLLVLGRANDSLTSIEPACRQLGSEEIKSVDFERHVAPLLGRLGCNSAACHGAFGGKGDLQLSLFGYSSELDFKNLSRHIDTTDAEYSMMLQKPSGLEDHEGGIRFEEDSNTFMVISQWIQAGAKWEPGSGQVSNLVIEPDEILFESTGETQEAEAVALTVMARFADGSSEDVTRFCQFASRDEGVATVSDSGIVQRVRNGDTSIIVSYSDAFAAVTTLVPFPETRQGNRTKHTEASIDSFIDAKLQKLNIVAATNSSDIEFLRRVTLDVIGTLPSPVEIRTFCADKSLNKREQKIDELLAHPMHAAMWATRLCDITKCDVTQMGESEQTAVRRAQMWHDWFRKRIAGNMSYSEIVRGVLTATSRHDLEVGDWVKRESALIQSSRDTFKNDYADREVLDLYWRRLGEDGKFPLKETAQLTAAAFTGVRLNCAQCHKHPFDRWTQDDYAAFTNIFSRVVFGNSSEMNQAVFAELESRRQARKRGESTKPLPQLSEVFLSEEMGRRVSGSKPKAKVTPRAFESPEFQGESDLREQFFEWLVAEDNPYFAHNFVNRAWAVYFGTGLVDPVDDFSISNPPSHPQLLDNLAEHFVKSNFDIRRLEKRILMSSAYQRSSTPGESNRNDRRNFARQYVRPLSAEVMLDVINIALGIDEDFGDDAPANALAIEVGANQLNSDAGRTLEVFGRGDRQSVCDCDRRTENDLRQFVFMVNDESVHNKIKHGRIRELLILDNRELIEQLYLKVLARTPEPQEVEVAEDHFAQANSRESGFDDLLWALLNSREFSTNH